MVRMWLLAVVVSFWQIMSVAAQPAGFPMPVPVAAPAEPDAILLYPDMGSRNTETWARFDKDMVVRNVTQPTLTPVLPDPAKATGAATIVAPGGAFMLLSMGDGGWEAARRLADQGIAAFVLKYRTLPTPADWREAGPYMMKRLMSGITDPNKAPTLHNPQAVEDALTALSYIRANAARFGVDPKRVGMTGFSAGAMTSLGAALQGDAARRPAFIGYFSGPQMAVDVPKGAPPLFVARALDDELFPDAGFGLVRAWHDAGASVEFHAYERGRHGFTFGKAGTTTIGSFDDYIAWLSMHGFLATGEKK